MNRQSTELASWSHRSQVARVVLADDLLKRNANATYAPAVNIHAAYARRSTGAKQTPVMANVEKQRVLLDGEGDFSESRHPATACSGKLRNRGAARIHATAFARRLVIGPMLANVVPPKLLDRQLTLTRV